MKTLKYYWEDLAPGSTRELGSVRPTKEEILAFAGQSILGSRPMGSRPNVGLVRTLGEMRNQRGDQVLHMEGWGMFCRRTPATTT